MKTKITDLDGFERVAAVRKNDKDTYDAKCSCGFLTSGWEKKSLAEERMSQHQEEHQSGEPVPELFDFREVHGLNGGPPAKPTVEWDKE